MLLKFSSSLFVYLEIREIAGSIRREKGYPASRADVVPGDHSQLPNGYETRAMRQPLLCRALFLLEFPLNSFRVVGYLVIFC